MSVAATCPSCGLRFHTNAISARGIRIVVTENLTNCPRCGSLASVDDATYEFDLAGRIISAVRSQGAIRADVVALQALAESVQAGVVSNEGAATLANEIGPFFGVLWTAVIKNDRSVLLLIAILSILLAFYTTYSADEAYNQQHTDAQNQTQAIATISKEIQNETQVQQRVYEELKRQSAIGLPPAPPSKPIQSTRLQPQAQTPEQVIPPQNRHERRKAAKIARKPPVGS